MSTSQMKSIGAYIASTSVKGNILLSAAISYVHTWLSRCSLYIVHIYMHITMKSIHGRYVKHYFYFLSVHVRFGLSIRSSTMIAPYIPTYRDGFVQPVRFYSWFHN